MEAHSAYIGVVRNWRTARNYGLLNRMISNYGQEITYLFIGIVAILWFVKIAFHFSYLKSKDDKVTEANFLEFFLKPKNFTKSLLVVAPFIFVSTDNGATEIQLRRTRIVTFILWVAFALTFIFLTKYPPRNEPEKIYIDLRG